MKREYQVPKSTTTDVDTQTMYLDNISFTVGTDPRGGWSDSKQRDGEASDADTPDSWSQGLW